MNTSYYPMPCQVFVMMLLYYFTTSYWSHCWIWKLFWQKSNNFLTCWLYC